MLCLALLRERDAATPAVPQMDLAITVLEHTSAEVVARAITPLLQDRARWPEALRTVLDAGIAVSQPTITADAVHNRLLISAPGPLMAMATELVRELDRPRAGVEALDVRVFNLRRADPAGVAEAVREAIRTRAVLRPGGPPATVTAEPSSGSIVVTASPEQIDEIEAIVRSLDEGIASDQAQVRTVFLKHARADAVARIIEQLLHDEPLPFFYRYDLARRGQAPFDAGPEIRVAADPRLNAVIISAAPGALHVVEQMVAQLDVEPRADLDRRRSVRVLHVVNADAVELAANVEALFAEPDVADTPPTVRVDVASNSLIVRATDAQFESIAGLVDEIDRATIATARQMRLIRIDPARASAAEIARTLERMLDRSGGSTVEVIPLEELLRHRTPEPEPADKPPPGASGRAGPRPAHRSLVFTLLSTALATAGSEEDEPAVTIAVDPATNCSLSCSNVTFNS